MTNQEAFARMVLHLRKQGMKSIMPDGLTCMYRSPNGLRCAVGVLLTDEVYSRDMEGKRASDLIVVVALHALGVSIDLASWMQLIHDTYRPDQWEDKWQSAAHQFNLTLPAPGHEHEYIPSPCAECEPAQEVVA